MSLAKVVISGTVESDPEKRYTPNNHAVTNFNISVKNPAFGNRANNDAPFSVKITCWRALADAVVGQIAKGDEVLVEGKLILNSFQSPEGVQKKSFEIEANNIDKLAGPSQAIVAEFSGGGEKGSAKQQPAQQPVGVAAAPQQQQPQAESFGADELLTDDDIPF